MCVRLLVALHIHTPRFLPQVAKSGSGVLHTDAFLYPEEEDIDELCESLHIGRWYCTECGSKKTKPLGKSPRPQVGNARDPLIPSHDVQMVLPWDGGMCAAAVFILATRLSGTMQTNNLVERVFPKPSLCAAIVGTCGLTYSPPRSG